MSNAWLFIAIRNPTLNFKLSCLSFIIHRIVVDLTTDDYISLSENTSILLIDGKLTEGEKRG